jgi:sRNA-binding protein
MSEDQAPAPASAQPQAPAVTEPQAAGQLLKQLFPALFAGAPKPIMLKVQQAIEARAPGRFTKKALSGFLARHTAGTGYLIALSKSEQRFDLDGQPAGPLSDEHREAAKQQLAARRQKQREREQEMEAARRWRQDLLRSFETSTLSRANFCTLKNVPEAQLDALLAQAREERAAMPPRPERSDRRPSGRPDPRRR